MRDLGLKSNIGIQDCVDQVLSSIGEDIGLSAMLSKGLDPLGSAFMECNTPEKRRASGSTYTPQDIVSSMIGCAVEFIDPDIVVDCGCGSGRFALACARAFPNARIIAVDNSEFACNMCRANSVAAGFGNRIEVIQADFTSYSLPRLPGQRVLWVGNPPYVRHHDIDQQLKARFKANANKLGIKASALSGLHIHFIASVACQWREGDLGVFITSAEWLDVNYGEFVRHLFADKLGLAELRVYDRREQVFEGTDATAAVVVFGRKQDRVIVCGPDMRRRFIDIEMFRQSSRWSALFQDALQADNAQANGKELVPLGSLVGVHRGVVTGNNKFWVRRLCELEGFPSALSVPVIAHAREIMGECIAQNSPASLNRLIVIPENLNLLESRERDAAETIIRQGEELGVNNGYVASRRRCWWSVKPPRPPAALMTYMGRKRPTFVMNKQKLPMLNVLHGLYPKVPMTRKAIQNLVDYLNGSVDMGAGRTYCGGLVKYEPREAEALLVPQLEVLEG